MAMEKHQQELKQFVSEPLGDKPVTALVGIGSEYAEILKKIGIQHAYQLLGKYLLVDKDEAKFKSWLRKKCGEGFGQNRQDNVHQCLKDWAARHIK